MEKENAINFLLYSYFGITLTSKADEVLCAAIDRAYRDASSHVLSIEGGNDDVRKAGCILLKEHIEQLVINKNEYKDWHFNICDALHKLAEAKGRVTYGIAQKWVNMTMKYLYLLNTIFANNDPNNSFSKGVGAYINNISKYLHVPLDRYIFAAAKIDKSTAVFDNSAVYGLSVKTKDYNLPDSWSKIEDYGNYAKYQEAIAKQSDCSPIDWEGPAWIEVAKKRKKQELEKQNNN